MNSIRSALRQLQAAPAFSFVAILTLALGIGANTAIFSVINGVLLRPLPFEEPDRLMRLYLRNANFPKASWAAGQFFSMRDDQTSFEVVAAWEATNLNLASAGQDPERIEGAVVTTGFLRALRTKPAQGRFFVDEEFAPGQDAVVVISHGLWHQRFAGDPNILGRSLLISGRPRLVVGVMPEAFTFPGKARIWAPFAPNEEDRTRRDLHTLQVFGRLEPGVTVEQAQGELKTLTGRYAREFPATDGDWSGVGFPMLEDAVAQIRPALLVLLASVLALLLIACANVTNLLLARAATRQREISLRAALGASRSQIVRQLLAESLVHFVAGGFAGVLVGRSILAALLAIAPATIPRLDQVHLDQRVFLFTSALTLLTGLVFGLIPAWTASRTDLVSALREGGHGVTVGRSHLRDGLVVVQVGATVVLLISSGLLLRSFHRLQQVDAGFRADHVMTMRVDLPEANYGTIGQTDEKRVEFVNQVVKRIEASPGIESAAVVTSPPLTGGPTFIMRLESNPNVTPSTAPVTRYRTITPDYFKVMGIPLLQGRFFTERDAQGSPRVVIINQALAKKFFPGVESPLGRRIEIGIDDPPQWSQVVGVVADVKIDSLEAGTPVQAYEPYHQFSFNNITVVARSSRDPKALAAAMRKEVLAVDPQQPVHTQKSMSQIVDDSLGQRYFSLLLVGVFATTALILAVVGLYGVISYGVARRTREFGVRLSIGASRHDIAKMVLDQSSRLIGAGLAVGLVGAIFSVQLFQSLLFGIGARDPLTFAGVMLLLGAVAVMASVIPALRAASVSPIVALRDE